MELRLTFKENDIRALYYETFDHEEHIVEEHLKERKNGSLILGSVALLFLYSPTFITTGFITRYSFRSSLSFSQAGHG